MRGCLRLSLAVAGPLLGFAGTRARFRGWWALLAQGGGGGVELVGHRAEDRGVARECERLPLAVRDDVGLVLADRVQHQRADLGRLHHAREGHVRGALLLGAVEGIADTE